MTTARTEAGSETIRNVDAQTLRSWVERGEAVVVDVREPDEHREAHLRGSVCVPLSSFDPARVPTPEGKRVVLHCRSGTRSTDAAGRLLACGWPEVTQLEGGIEAWKKSGLPVERTPGATISIQRQVQITAGSLVVAGAALGYLVSPWFYLLSAFVGAGLVFAGVTNTCGMAALLGRMPWNTRAA